MTKPFLSLLCLLLTAPLLRAAQGDTLRIMSWRAAEPVKLLSPVMRDSIDIRGTAYDPFTTITGMPKADLDSPLLHDLVTDSVIHLEGGMRHQLYASLLSTAYEEAHLYVSCPVPYKLSLGGRFLGERNRVQETAAPDCYDIAVYPSAHRILTIEAEASRPADLAIYLVPKRAGHTITLRTDAEEYMSMDFGRTGEGLAGVTMSPSGKYVILTTTRMVDLATYYSAVLYEDGRRVGILPEELARAQWMPRSDRLYFTRKTDHGRQLYAYDPARGEAELLSAGLPEGYFTIAPTEDFLIYYKETPGDPQDRYVDRVLSRDDHRYLSGPRSRSDLWLYDLASGVSRPLTYGYRTTALGDISPDGKRIIFSVTDNDVPTEPFFATAYYELELATMKTDTLFAPTATLSYVGYTSDPSRLLVLGTPEAFDGLGRDLPDGMISNTYETEIYLYDRSAGRAKVFTKDFDPAVQSVRAAQHELKAIFSAADRDYLRLYSLDLRSGAIRALPVSEEYVGSFAVDGACRRYAYTGESANRSVSAFLGDAAKGTDKALLDLAAVRMKHLQMGEVADWSFTMPDGGVVPGRYYLPPSFDSSQKYPLLVYYYGGTSPTGRMFDWYYSQPMYAAQDYVVLVLNPSGTTGWGQEYSARHVNAWGDRTADEIIAAVKGFAESHPYVRADRIGCFGASYGGFMTEYLLTKTDLFACGISHAGISALSSYWGQGTWGIGYSAAASSGSYPWNNPRLYAEHSPLFRADKIHTPLLLTHGTSDTNVPLGESVQLYNALKILGRPVEMIRVYGEDHHIMNLQARERWMHSMMAWFQKWLKDDSAWWDRLYPERHY